MKKLIATLFLTSATSLISYTGFAEAKKEEPKKEEKKAEVKDQGFKKYSIEPSHTTVSFEVSHLVIATVEGRFDKFEGSFEYDDAKAELKNATISIDATSINTNQAKRDEHLRSPEFFDTAKFPTLTLKDMKIETKDHKPVKLSGNITIHGVTKPITFDVDYKGIAKDPWGNTKIVMNLKSVIQRKDFGLTWNKVLETGGVAVGEEVAIKIHMESDQAKG